MPISFLEIARSGVLQKPRCVIVGLDYPSCVEDFELIEEWVEKWEVLPANSRKPGQQWVIDVVRTLDLIETQGLQGFWRCHVMDADRILRSLRLTGNTELADALGKSRFCVTTSGSPGLAPALKNLSAVEKAQLNRLLFEVTDRIEAARDGLVELLPREDDPGASESDQDAAVATLNIEVTERVSCPYCGQSMDLVIDTSIAQQRSTTDCEVCCRPFEVLLECEPGSVTSLTIEA